MNVINACIVDLFQIDAMVQMDTQCSCKSPQFDVATKGK